jgi:hypothetical protein
LRERVAEFERGIQSRNVREWLGCSFLMVFSLLLAAGEPHLTQRAAILTLGGVAL